jgi:hypothetical protein
MRRLFRGIAALVATTFVITLTACSSGGSSPTGPSPSSTATPAPSPSPSPGQPPPAAFGIAAITLSQSEVESQAEPQATLSLTSAAPAGGVLVTLSSSNSSAVQVPSAVIVPAGLSATTFTVITSSVVATTAVTISASYGSVTRTAALTVLPPTLRASFTVRSPAKGADACLLGPTDDVDCSLDAASSRGFVARWHWRYWAGVQVLGHTTSNAVSRPALGTRCAFLDGSRGGDNPDGTKYVQMTIELVVEDGWGALSAPVHRAVKLYPNSLCGFSY